MEEFMSIALKALAALLAAGGCWLVVKAQALWPQIKAWIVSKTDLITEEQLDNLVTDTVAAADQLLKAEDPDGTKRNTYVTDVLTKAGVELTDAVMAKIEAKVLALGHLDTSK